MRLGHFHALHRDGRDLITGWIKRAEETRSARPFEAFVYAWIGFNGWATCVCGGEERDRTLLRMMEVDGGLTRNFDRLMRVPDFESAARSFSSLWPIFKVADLPAGVRISRPEKRGRAAVVGHYQSECPNADRAPDCHMTHTLPLEADWSHTLEALYRVRCNLFHGQKSGGGNEDRAILDAAVQVLLPVARSVLNLN